MYNHMGKSMKNRTTFIGRLLMVMVGVVIASFGVAMYLKAGFGTDPITTFVVGVSTKLGISVGRASQLSMIVVLIAIFFIDKKRIGIGTFVNTFLTGEFLNMFMRLNIEPSILWYRLIILITGIVCFSLGLSMYALSELGEGPVDSIMSIIKDKFGISIEKARIILDIALVILGYSLGASVGIGTILGMVLTGVIMGQIIRFVNR